MPTKTSQRNQLPRIGMLVCALLLFIAGYFFGQDHERRVMQEHAVLSLLEARTSTNGVADLKNLYEYYMSFSNLHYHNRLVIEFIGDIYYCEGDYGSALENYKLSLEIVRKHEEPERETVALSEKIEALQNSLPESRVFSERVTCTE